MRKGWRMPRGTPDPKLGAAIRHAREDRNLPQQRLAEAAGLALSTLQRLEAGQADPSWSTVRSLAKALGITPGQLVARAEAR
jgi:transcriptional regulator with XRE-family HTH domain